MSIQRTGPNSYRVYLGYDKDGKVIWQSGLTLAQARLAEANYKESQSTSETWKPLTLKMMWWLQDYREEQEARGISHDELGGCTRFLTRVFSEMSCPDAVELHVYLDIWFEQEESRVRPGTIRNHRTRLNGFFKYLMRKGHLDHNPLDRVRRAPKSNAKEVPPFTEEQLRILLRVGSETTVEVAHVLAVTGMRFSELTALGVAAVNLNDHSPYIQVGKSKTKASSNRKVYLDEAGVRVLKTVIDGKAQEELVVSVKHGSGRGNPIRSAPFHTYHWQPAMRAARATAPELDWDGLVVHSLRHTYAHMWMSAGLPLPELQRQLGHTNLYFTNDRYGGIYDGSRAQTAKNSGLFDGIV